MCVKTETKDALILTSLQSVWLQDKRYVLHSVCITTSACRIILQPHDAELGARSHKLYNGVNTSQASLV